jgi:RNA polymerase sigma-70 factor (ECF subfamily)
MSSERGAQIEARVNEALDAADYDLALTVVIRGYGGELLGFIESRVGSLDDAREAFGWFSEDLWRSLPSFERRCTLRTWAYALARNAASRFVARELSPRKRVVPLSRVSRLSLLMLAESSRDSSQQQADQITRLRAQLSEEEQLLLTLRVDRGLEWKDVARVITFGDGAVAEADLDREALRLRQRFHVLKAKLRELHKAGLDP